jgi:pilus retraction protein PilT
VSDADWDPLALLGEMSTRGASDLFLCEGEPPALRKDGAIQRLDAFGLITEWQMDSLIASVLEPERQKAFFESGDLDLGYSARDGQRYRLNLSRQQGRRQVVARLVPSGALDFASLRLPDGVRQLVEQMRGLVLVTGATGSGKSTTMAAMVHHINQTRSAHVVTVEDPIEYIHRSLRSRITQREVGSDTQSFHAALRHVVRQSPDVIVVGEMRDAETMSVALSAALTGHLVLGSLHTVDASRTLQRILSYFPEHLRAQAAMDLSLSLRGIVSQRLVPVREGEGRVVAVEIMGNSPAVATLLREQRVDEVEDVMKALESTDMITFNQSLLRLFKEGTIKYEVGLANSSQPDEYALLAKGMASGVDGFRAFGGVIGDTGLDMKAILRAAMEKGASDVHLTAGRRPIIRIDGHLELLSDMPLSDTDMRILLNSVMSWRQRSIYELEREIDFAVALEDRRRFRVNAYFQKARMAAALRAIPDHIPSSEKLGLPEGLIDLADRPQGLFLVVGPTGSGKTTTLACIVDRINRTRSCRIVTVEDPIEYVHRGMKSTVDQREVYADTKSFSAGLKYILRQDPDVILVGEMRDQETISSALTAAETGHLVLATLHSNDAIQAVDRMIDVFPPHQQQQVRSQVAAALLGVVSQRLLPRKDQVGRVAVFEQVVATPAIRTLIRDNKLHQAATVIEASRRDGMITMDEALKQIYSSGVVSYDEVVRHLRNPRAIVPPSAVQDPMPVVTDDEAGEGEPEGPTTSGDGKKRSRFW